MTERVIARLWSGREDAFIRGMGTHTHTLARNGMATMPHQCTACGREKDLKTGRRKRTQKSRNLDIITIHAPIPKTPK